MEKFHGYFIFGNLIVVIPSNVADLDSLFKISMILSNQDFFGSETLN